MKPVLILIAVDDPGFRASVVFALEAEEFKVVVVDPAHAELFAKWAADAACIVIDHRPLRLDGVALVERLRTIGVPTPAIIVSSANASRLKGRIAASGAELIEKPLLGDMLITAIRKVTGSLRTGPPEP